MSGCCVRSANPKSPGSQFKNHSMLSRTILHKTDLGRVEILGLPKSREGDIILS